jgi:hypothetical protein
MKICPVRAELFHAAGRAGRGPAGRTDRQTDMAMLIVAYVNFANVYESAAHCVVSHHFAINRDVTSTLGENLLYTTNGSPVS